MLDRSALPTPIQPVCDMCSDDRHNQCTVLVDEKVPDRPREVQLGPCSCDCGGGDEAWRV
jgi:hypothetical protein